MRHVVLLKIMTGILLSMMIFAACGSNNSDKSQTLKAPRRCPITHNGRGYVREETGAKEEQLRNELPTSVHTSNFPDLLRHFNITLAVTTYQAGKLILLRPEGDKLNTHFRSFSRPMGMAVNREHFHVGCRREIYKYVNIPEVADKIESPKQHDAVYVRRSMHTTGEIDIHEMAYGNEGLWFINTRFSTLCTLHENFSFVPRWKPEFITRLVPEDRCHLNGLCMENGVPRYVTAGTD